MLAGPFAVAAVALAVVLSGTSLAADSASSPKADETAGLAGAVTSFDKIQPVESEWGSLRWFMNGKLDPDAEMTLGMVFIKPNQTNPAHIHPNSAEFLHVLEGSCEHMVGKKWVSLKKGDTLRIPKGIPHKARTRSEPCKAILVYNTGDRQFVEVKE